GRIEETSASYEARSAPRSYPTPCILCSMNARSKSGQNMQLKIIIVLVMLTTLAATNASAQAVGTQSWAPNLSGLYRCVHRCTGARLGRIVARGWQLTLTGESGETTTAWIDWPGHI